MEEVVQILQNCLDYENNYYFYHETGYGNGQDICDEGLLVNGTNILEVQNILFTTAAPLTEELTNDENDFADFLIGERRMNNIREISDMVILGIPKEDINLVVEPLKDKSEKEYNVDANYIVDSRYILGYVNLMDEEIILNENYFDYNEDYTY